jgi:hypothetical protein
LAKEINADLVLLDDPEARTTAEYMGLKRIGTIGILQLALKQKILTNIIQDIEELINKGFRISSELYDEIVRKQGLKK